jgi:DNA-binding XRE family transcriptional regulator
MTADEFRAARERLGLTPDGMAIELGLTPRTVAAIEAGSHKVSRGAAGHLALLVAADEQTAVLLASGLPPCPVYEAWERGVEGQNAEQILASLARLDAHAAECPLCTARSDYLRIHGPPDPAPTPPWPMRILNWIHESIDYLPGPLRPPPGEAGEGRRVGAMLSVPFSLLVIVIAGVGSIIKPFDGGPEPGWTGEALKLCIVVPLLYGIGFYLSGWGFDITRSLRHRFVGYVLRGTLTAASVYGTAGVMMTFVEEGHGWMDVLVITPIFSLMGAIAGAIYWMKHRKAGTIPPPLAR